MGGGLLALSPLDVAQQEGLGDQNSLSCGHGPAAPGFDQVLASWLVLFYFRQWVPLLCCLLGVQLLPGFETACRAGAGASAVLFLLSPSDATSIR